MTTGGASSAHYQRRWRRPMWATVVAGCLGALPAAAEPPPSGIYMGRMCVQPVPPASGTADCGPVEIVLLDPQHANVRIADIVYRLELDHGRIDVILMHGTMQIDGFTTRYAWQGTTLDFSDLEKGRRYRIHFEPVEGQTRR